MATLEGTVARGDDDDVAVLVCEALGLDVARLVEVALDEALAAAESRDCFTNGGLEQLGNLLDGAGDLEATTATTECRLDRDRNAMLFGELHDFVGVCDGIGGTGDERSADLLRDVTGLDLVTEGIDGLRGRADPGESGVDDGLREFGVLGEKSVSRVHGIRAGTLGDAQDLLDVQVGVGWRRAIERIRLIRELGEQSV